VTPIERLLPYRDLPEQPLNPHDDYQTRLQGVVSYKDKMLLMSVIPDRGIFTLLLQQAIKTTAEYVRTNNLSYGPDATAQLLSFVLGGPFTRAAGDDSQRHDDRTSEGVQHAPACGADQPSNLHQVPQSRSAQEVRKDKIRQAVKRTKRTGVE
jgi:hypothetical protein